jgi:prepilin-type N-terminal cleavage/methylation domain-containing protein
VKNNFIRKEREKMWREKGFTLIELIIVVAILAILAVIAIPRITTSTATAQANSCSTNVGTMNSEIEMYNSDKGAYPATLATITGDANYFPSGAPVCPSGGTYTMDASHRCHCSIHGP